MALEKGIGNNRWLGDFSVQDTRGDVVLQTRDISLSFGEVVALDGVDFEVYGNEVVSLVGPNGAGKTSLLNCINKFYEPDTGEIRLNGVDITGYRPDKVAAAGVARTFQNIELFDELTTIENIKVGNFVNRKSTTPWWHAIYPKNRESRRAAEEIIELLDLEEIRDEHAGELPFGTRKMIDLGRALIAKPDVLLLDEPSAGLSVEEKEDMFRYLQEVRETTGMSVVLVEHDVDLVVDLSDRIVVLALGKKIADGPPERVMEMDRVLEAYTK